MHFAICCFLNLIILYFSFHVINASNHLFTDTDNGQNLPGNTCSEGQCYCKEGFVPNSKFTQCLRIAKTINDLCEEDVQCQTFVNAVCINTTCQYRDVVQTYVKNVLGGQCERDDDCEHSTVGTAFTRFSCVSGLCKCKSLEKGQCASLIEPCIEPLCSGFNVKMRLNQKTCVPGRCECPEERQFCTNEAGFKLMKSKKSNRAGIIDEGESVRGHRKYTRAVYNFVVTVIKDWYDICCFFLVVFMDSIRQSDRSWTPMLLKFFWTFFLYYGSHVFIKEFGADVYLFVLISFIIPIVAAFNVFRHINS